MKKIIITIFDENDGDLNGIIELESEEYVFNYSRTLSHHGLQCKYDGNTYEYYKLMKHLNEIGEIVKKIEENNKK